MSSSDEIDLDPKLAAVPSAAGVAGPERAEAVAGTDAIAGAGELSGTAEIASALASGRIDALTAQRLLIEQVLAEQLPRDLDPAALERLRTEVAALIGDDPTLARLLGVL